MGVWGWDEIQDGVTVKGFVRGKAKYHSDDGDWCFFVEPAPEFKQLLTNPHGFTNKNAKGEGLIECEIQPTNEVYPSSGLEATVDPQATVDKYLGRISNKWVTVAGTWVRDRGHNYKGEEITVGKVQIGFLLVESGLGDEGKTEIHPITSLLVEYPPEPDNRSRKIDFLVFSSGGSANQVWASTPQGAPSAPHTNENRRGEFDILVPDRAFEEPGSFKIVSQTDMSASQGEFTVFFGDSIGFYRFLQGRVWSGKVSDGKGFYHVTIEIHPGYTLRTYLASRGVNPQLGIRDLMARAAKSIPNFQSSVRALFQQF